MYRPALLFALGLGLNSSWWLCLSANPSVWVFTDGNASWVATAVMHLTYLAVHLLCLMFTLPLAKSLRKGPLPAALGTLTALSSLAIGTLSNASLPLALHFACLVVGSAANAVLFLGWMTLFVEKLHPSMRLFAVIASMALSSALWLVTANVPSWATLAVCAAMPLASAALFHALRSWPIEAGHADTATTDAKAPTRPATPLLKLLTPTFLIGIAAYELVPGFVTSIAHVNSMDSLYAFYAEEMLTIACLCLVFGRKPGFMRIADRFVLPLLSVGLIALGLFSANQVDVALAASLSGSMLFEAFLFCRLAHVAQAHGAEPLRVFALGGTAMQAGLCASYLLVAVLSSPAQITVACVALLLVILFVVGEPFFARQETLVPDGSVAPAPHDSMGEGAAQKGELPNLATPSPTRMFQETCAAFGASLGLSARESDVLLLAMQGKNMSTLADELGIAPSTVKTHLRSIYHKAGVADRQELIARFQEFQG